MTVVVVLEKHIREQFAAFNAVLDFLLGRNNTNDESLAVFLGEWQDATCYKTAIEGSPVGSSTPTQNNAMSLPQGSSIT
jgi:hypothetical protein